MYSIFYKPSKTDDDLPLLLPKLLINDKKVERVESIKFLGVLLDEHLSWTEHIRYTKNKVAESIGLFYSAKLFLGKHSLLTLTLHIFPFTLIRQILHGLVRTEPFQLKNFSALRRYY